MTTEGTVTRLNRDVVSPADVTVVRPVEIAWHEDLPIFARESFLNAVGDEYGWLGGWSEAGGLRCVLPYTIIRKALCRIVRFRTETIPLQEDLGIAEENAFLDGAIRYFRSAKADLVMPATTNSVFRTYPAGADVAPYGSYVIDLSPSEDTLWKNVDRITRQNIRTAARAGVAIVDASAELDLAHDLIESTQKRSNLPFMNLASFRRFVDGLDKYGRVLKADYGGATQSVVVFGYSTHTAYAIYAGNLESQQPGSNKLLYWEAIRLFRGMGAHRFDFVGARIDPARGTKEAALGSFKSRFGATLKRGYIWKYSLSPLKYRLYGLAARVRSGGDIVDLERHKMSPGQDTA